MTIRIRTLSAIAAVAFALTAAASIASAQPPQGRGPGGRGFGPGGGPAPYLRQLNLTESQRDQIKAVMDEERKQDQSPMRKLGSLERDLRAEVMADTPDAAKIEQLRTQIVDAQAAALSVRIDLETKIAQILTPDQRKQAREMMAKQPERHETRQ